MSDMLKIIRERHSSRGQFNPAKPIPEDQLNMILEAARWAPTAHNMQNYEIILLDDKKVLDTIGKIKSMPSEEFIRENFAQLSTSEAELRRKKTGILGTQFPPTWRDASKLDEAVKERTLTPLSATIRGGQTILLILYDMRKRAPASEGDVLGFFSLGCVMENIWLMAQALGISVHIMSAFSGQETALQLKKILNIPDYLAIGFACKLGYPLAEAASQRVRRDREDFIHHNT
jgi:nitroreductase